MKTPAHVTLLVMMLLVCVGSTSWAQDGQERVKYEEYFTVAEPPKTSDAEISEFDPPTSFAPTEIFWNHFSQAVEMGEKLYTLLSFTHHNEAYGNVNEPYNRMKHFGTWISKDPNGYCGNTRAEVLRRESTVPVTMNPNGCTVKSGRWDDPYTGRAYTSASDLQIDHFVPLKNAYVSGADKWNDKKRCLYANYMGNEFHLLAVFGRENTRKSDRSPDGYMPPNRAYQCQYLAQWLKVKMIWSLGLTPPEKAAIETFVQDNHCTANDLIYSQGDLQKQRRYIVNNMNLCQ